MQVKEQHKTVCSYCGVGCGITVSKDSKGVLAVKGTENYPVNKGMLCTKGKTLNYVAQDTSNRILYPSMRWSRSHKKQHVSWDIAIY